MSLSIERLSSPFAAAVPCRHHLCDRGLRGRRKAICGLFPATSSCPAAAGSMFRPISAGLPPRRVARTFRRDGNPKQSQAKSRTRARRQKNRSPPRNPGNAAGVDWWRRAKPPSPSPSITRRRTPAASSGRGSLLLGNASRPGARTRPSGWASGSLLSSVDTRHSRTDDQIVAMNHFRAAAEAENRTRWRRTIGRGFFAHPRRHRHTGRGRFPLRRDRG